MLEVNGTAQLSLVGNESTPVLVVDGVLKNARTLVDFACQRAEFYPAASTWYPGIKAALPKGIPEKMTTDLESSVREAFRIPADLRCTIADQFFSLVSRPPQHLHLLQRLPHFDSHVEYFFACLLYLNEGDFSGTGFFRHRPTGYERVNASRLEHYVQAAKRYIQQHGEPPMDYLRDGDAHFQLIHSVPYRANRLIVYPGNLLHSGLINAEKDVDANPASGRLTANIFLEFA